MSLWRRLTRGPSFAAHVGAPLRRRADSPSVWAGIEAELTVEVFRGGGRRSRPRPPLFFAQRACCAAQRAPGLRPMRSMGPDTETAATTVPEESRTGAETLATLLNHDSQLAGRNSTLIQPGWR